MGNAPLVYQCPFSYHKCSLVSFERTEIHEESVRPPSHSHYQWKRAASLQSLTQFNFFSMGYWSSLYLHWASHCTNIEPLIVPTLSLSHPNFYSFFRFSFTALTMPCDHESFESGIKRLSWKNNPMYSSMEALGSSLYSRYYPLDQPPPI